MGPIMTVMGILWRVEGPLKEADTCMQDGDETSWWQLTDTPPLATLKQTRQVTIFVNTETGYAGDPNGKRRDSVLDLL
jgi:hypothetical protein